MQGKINKMKTKGVCTIFPKKHHHHQPQQQHSFNFVKLPSFHGSNDPSLYLDWEAKVEHISTYFSCVHGHRRPTG